MARLQELALDECRRLLDSESVGRLAVPTPTGIQLMPVNYVVVGDAVCFGLSPYSVLGSHVHDSLVAFEIDELDPEHHTGWSVQARGRARIVTDDARLEEIRRALPKPWADGRRTLAVELEWSELTGRRL